MARAIAECRCSQCGAKFEKVQFRPNRKMADEWKEWAEENCTTCPDCWQKEQQEKAAAKAAAIIERFSLPEITGKSERQIKFAADLRNKLLVQPETAKNLQLIAECLNNEQCKEQAEKEGMSVEAWVAKAIKRKWYNGDALWTVYKFGEARYIIDALINA